MMELEVLKTVGQIAGIGGISLGVFLLLFRDIIRKKIFPQLTKNQGFQLLILISVLIWSIALSGIGAWIWSNKQSDTVTNRIIKQPIVNESNAKPEEGDKIHQVINGDNGISVGVSHGVINIGTSGKKSKDKEP